MIEAPADVTEDDSHLWMMERQPWKQWLHRQLPRRFRDLVPEPPPPLPPAHIAESLAGSDKQPPVIASINQDENQSIAARIGSRICHIFSTPRNVFGLSRRYYSKEMPTNDPEEEISFSELSNIPDPPSPSTSASRGFYPYPNRNAFLLGDWFWNGGVQKSQSSFRELVNIVGNLDFEPADVQGVRWDQINKELATDDEGEWVDEDAGWQRTPVTISVPYQPRRGIPSRPNAGPQNFVVSDFYHRSLVSVIRDKLSRSSDFRLFHLHPHELLWKLPNQPEPICVQGELYTSPAFINADRELQDAPGEPGCDLPRVVIALMFWSDATHLTSFGNSKIHPLYMYFGNESKYRRCKPSCHLCEHVAYFQTVSPNTMFSNKWRL